MARRDSLPSSLHYRSVLRILDRIIAGKKHIRLIVAPDLIVSMRCSGFLSSICGAKGPFPAAAMVVVLVVFLRQIGKSTESSVRDGLNI